MVAELTCRAGVRTAGYARLGTARARDVLPPGRRISWPALNQIVCALRFFNGVTLGQAAVPERIAYAREPSRLPVVLSPDEVVRFLEASKAAPR
jgi:hypothetical protein